MKTTSSLLLLVIGYLTASTCEAQTPYTPETVAVLVNYCKVSLTKIVDNADKVVLDEEYDAIINNIDVTRVRDDETADLFKRMLTCLIEKRLRDEEREQVREIFNQQMDNAIYEAFSSPGSVFASGGTPIGIAASALQSLVSGYFNYKRSITRYKTQLNKELWQLKKDELQELTTLRGWFFDTEYTLYKRYNLPDRLRLSEKQVQTLSTTLSNPDLPARIRLLEGYKSDFEAYPAFWFYLGLAYQQLGNKPQALKCYAHFDDIYKPILREDAISAAVSINRLQLLDPAHDKSRIAKNLHNIEDNNKYYYKWEQILLAALAYAQIGDYGSAQQLIQRNIDHRCSLPNHYKLRADINSELALKQLPTALRRVVSGQKPGIPDALNTITPHDEYNFLRAARPLLVSVQVDITSQKRSKLSTSVSIPLSLLQTADAKELTNAISLTWDEKTFWPTGRTTTNSHGTANAVYTFEALPKPAKAKAGASNDVVVQIRCAQRPLSLYYSLVTLPKAEQPPLKKFLPGALVAIPYFQPVTAPIALYVVTAPGPDSMILLLHGLHTGNTRYNFVDGDLVPSPYHNGLK